jgi:hypothetical protein
MKTIHQKLCAFAIATAALSVCARAQSVPPAWNATTSYKIGDLVTYGGNTFQCQLNETTNHPNPHLVGWVLDYVYTGNFLIPVGPSVTFTTLTSAWNYIKSARISPGLTITLSLQPNYTENFSSSFSLDHAYGSQISIIGNGTGQTANFTHQACGFILDKGNKLGEISGLKIQAPSNGSDGVPAIEVQEKAVLANANNLNIENFDVAIESDSGEVDNLSLLTVNGFKTAFLSSGNGSLLHFSAAVTLDGSGSTTTPSHGFSAVQSGSISCPGSAVNNCLNGFDAESAGTIYCAGSSAKNTIFTNTSFGYYAYDRGMIFANNATTTGFWTAFKADTGGSINADGAQTSGYSYDNCDASHASTIFAVGANAGSNEADSTSTIVTM